MHSRCRRSTEVVVARRPVVSQRRQHGSSMAYPHLFEPIDVGPITIPNRIVRTAHGTMLTGEALIAYHEARAAGGVGMSTLEATGVHASAPSATPLYSDDVIPIYRQLMDRIRPY